MFRLFSPSLNALYRIQDHSRRLRNLLAVTIVGILGTTPLIAYLAHFYFPLSSALLVPVITVTGLVFGLHEYRKMLIMDRRIALEIRFLLYHSKARLSETVGLGETIWSESHLYRLFRQDFHHAGVDIPYDRVPVARRRLYDTTMAHLCPTWSSLLVFLLPAFIWILIHLPERFPSVVTEGNLKYTIALGSIAVAMIGELAGIFVRALLSRRFGDLRDCVVQMLEDVHEHQFKGQRKPRNLLKEKISKESRIAETESVSTLKPRDTAPAANVTLRRETMNSEESVSSESTLAEHCPPAGENARIESPAPFLSVEESDADIRNSNPPPIPDFDFADIETIAESWEANWKKASRSDGSPVSNPEWSTIIPGLESVISSMENRGDGKADSLHDLEPILSVSPDGLLSSDPSEDDGEVILPEFVPLTECI